MTDTDDRIDALERRLADVEDRLALMQIIASYGPAADSGSAESTADIWTEDGTYDTFPVVLDGHEDIAAMVAGELHQRLIQGGAAHLQGPPHIEIDGDQAVVTHYSQLLLRNNDDDSFRVWRTGVNRWEFARTAVGWKAVHRVNRQLDGSAEARALLAAAVSGGAGASIA